MKCCIEENGSSGEQLTKQNGLNDGNKQKTNRINIIPLKHCFVIRAFVADLAFGL